MKYLFFLLVFLPFQVIGQQDTTSAEIESIMKRQPAAGFTDAQIDHIASAGVFISKGGGQILGGMAIAVAGTLIGWVLIDRFETPALIFAGAGAVLGVTMTITGITKIRKGGLRLKAIGD